MDKKKLDGRLASSLIDIAGGTTKVAKLFKVSPTYVSDFRTKGMGRAYVLYLSELHRGHPFFQTPEVVEFLKG